MCMREMESVSFELYSAYVNNYDYQYLHVRISRGSLCHVIERRSKDMESGQRR